jgi:hypothetical protein
MFLVNCGHRLRMELDPPGVGFSSDPTVGFLVQEYRLGLKRP